MRFISWKKLVDRRGTSLSNEKRRVISDPQHPRPVRISPGRSAFIDEEIDDYDRWLVAKDRGETELDYNGWLAAKQQAERDAAA